MSPDLAECRQRVIPSNVATITAPNVSYTPFQITTEPIVWIELVVFMTLLTTLLLYVWEVQRLIHLPYRGLTTTEQF